MRVLRLISLSVCLTASTAVAEEGMYLFTDFPSSEVQQRHGFAPDARWLEHVRLSSVRLAGGCSASFVSPRGLVMTNHHCVRSCIEDLSTAKNDYLEHGFVSRSDAQERRCDKFEANQLVEITDVTAKVHAATKGLTGAAFNEALKKVQSQLESECATSADMRCDVVKLFHGAVFHLYRYKRFQDVRLAFAPEFPMAAFGGDPDNFNFPRYGFDAAFLRVYENGKPASTPSFFRWSKAPAKAGELTFVSGHPGGTERKQTISQLTFQRDVALPHTLLYLAEERGLLTQYMKGSADRFRNTRAKLRSVENARKALKGRHAFLADPASFAGKVKEERSLREAIAKDPALKQRFASAWDEVAEAIATYRTFYVEHRMKESGDAFNSELFDHARTLVRAAEELPKPNGERLREYTDARLPALKQDLFSSAPIVREIDEMLLTFSLSYLQSELGADDPFVRTALGRKSPATVARETVRGTRLHDPAYRKKLFEGGKKAIDASKDPMILLARRVDADGRAIRKRYEEEVDAVLTRNGERIAQAYVAVHGTSGYPDATFTLRLSYGQVKGWTKPDGTRVDPLTTYEGLFARHTGEYPFAVSPKWLKAKKKLDLSTPMNVATTNDIIGGNSGSPLIDRNGRIIGLIFDGNLPSLGGRYGYDAETNRAVAVHGQGLFEALGPVYGAHRIAKELVVE